MISIAEIVRKNIESDEITFESLRRGILNCNAYSRIIHKQIEEECMEKIHVGTVAAALRRLEKQVSTNPPLKPEIKLSNISLTSPLFELTYHINEFDYGLLAKIFDQKMGAENFIATTQGSKEISIICNKNIYDFIKKESTMLPLFEMENLGAITAEFSEDFFHEANLIFSLVSQVAKKKIDLIEIISTYTELTFVVHEKDMIETLTQLKRLM